MNEMTPQNNTERTSTASSKPKKQLPWIVETLLIVVVVLAVVGIFQAFVGRQYVIPSGSMEPTLHGCQGCTNDRVFVQKLSYYNSEPKPGDVIVFEGTEDWNDMWESPRSPNPTVAKIQEALSKVSLAPPNENNLVKRVIATGGQEVSCQEGDEAVMVDGKPIKQDYVLDPPTYAINPKTGSEACGGDYFGPVTVPEDHLFMMGDSRTNSRDSRAHLEDGLNGSIPLENVRGKVELVFFPFNNFGKVEAPDVQQ